MSNANLPTKHPELSELTARGQQEANQIADAFSQAPDLIVVSPYLRAQQTAVPTRTRFPHTPVAEWPVYEFTYLHPERYNGTTGSQRTPHSHAYWQRNDPHEKEGGQGESFAQLLERVQQTINLAQQQTADFIAVFSHGLFLRALLFVLLSPETSPTAETMSRYRHFVQGLPMGNGAILEVTWAANGRVYLSGLQNSHTSTEILHLN